MSWILIHPKKKKKKEAVIIRFYSLSTCQLQSVRLNGINNAIKGLKNEGEMENRTMACGLTML